MTREQIRPPWWAVVVSGLCGALLAGAAVVLAPHAHPVVQAAAAQRPADVAAATPSVTFIGDSWTEGVGATALRGYAVLTGEQLGWRYEVLGVGGSGYDVKGRGSTFGERIDRAVSTHPDVIVVQGSLNERTSTPASLAPAALSTLTRLRAAAGPGTKILVVGASYTPGTPVTTINWINGIVRDDAVKAGLTFVNPAVQEWTNPADKRIWSDPNHPNDVGHQLVADHLEGLLRGMLEG
jgi:lysophospholipase L1-like esterase